MRRLEGYFRHDVLRLLDKKNGCIGVDMYADGHDINQYKQVLRRVGMMSPYKLLRMTFDEA